jgi:anti-sigma factor RsiW
MSDPSRPIAEEELHAFVDGCLDEDRRPTVFRYLQEHPEVAHRVAAYQAQRDNLRNVLGGVAAEPIPPRLSLERLIQERLGRQWRFWPAAACVVIGLGLGATGGWFLRGDMPPNPAIIALLTQEAVANHVVYSADKRRPTELGATQREDLARWVSNRLNHSVSPPDLSAEGYNYMGGRLAATQDGPAGLFMYDNAQGVRITVFVLPLHSAASAPIQHVDFAHVDGCAWIDKNIGYTVVGNRPPAELRRLAEIVRQQFEGTT